MVWNKLQDYQVLFILTDHFWVRRFDGLTRHLRLDLSFVGQLESCLLIARQHGYYNSHVNRRFSNTLNWTVIAVQ